MFKLKIERTYLEFLDGLDDEELLYLKSFVDMAFNNGIDFLKDLSSDNKIAIFDAINPIQKDAMSYAYNTINKNKKFLSKLKVYKSIDIDEDNNYYNEFDMLKILEEYGEL